MHAAIRALELGLTSGVVIFEKGILNTVVHAGHGCPEHRSPSLLHPLPSFMLRHGHQRPGIVDALPTTKWPGVPAMLKKLEAGWSTFC